MSRSHEWVMYLKNETPKSALEWKQCRYPSIFFPTVLFGTREWMVLRLSIGEWEEVPPMDLLPSFMVCSPVSNTHQSAIRPENLEVWSSYTSLRSHLHLFFPSFWNCDNSNWFKYKYFTQMKVAIFYTIEKWLWNLQHCSYCPFHLPLPDDRWY